MIGKGKWQCNLFTSTNSIPFEFFIFLLGSDKSAIFTLL